MKIETQNGFVEILDIIPYSVAKRYTREVTRVAVSLGIDGKSQEEIQAILSDESRRMLMVDFGFQMEDAKEALARACISSSSFGDIEDAIENYRITPQDIEIISIEILKKIEAQNAKKKDTQTTSEA